MKTSELIAKLQEEVKEKGDKTIVFAANKHSYKDAKLCTKDDTTTFALFDKIED